MAFIIILIILYVILIILHVILFPIHVCGTYWLYIIGFHVLTWNLCLRVLFLSIVFEYHMAMIFDWSVLPLAIAVVGYCSWSLCHSSTSALTRFLIILIIHVRAIVSIPNGVDAGSGCERWPEGEGNLD